MKKSKLCCLFLAGLLVMGLLLPGAWLVQANTGIFDVQASLSATQIHVGEAITLDFTITGGTPPYDLSLIAFADGMQVTDDYRQNSDGKGSYTYFPKFGSKGYIMIWITDADGEEGYYDSESFQIVDPDPKPPISVESLTLDKTSVAVGEPIKASWTISGGTPPYSIEARWLVFEDEEMENEIRFPALLDGDSSIFTPSVGLFGGFSLSISDQVGRYHHTYWGENQFTITGSKPVEPLSCDIVLSSTTVAVGEEITATIAPSGGTPPYKHFGIWYVTEANGQEHHMSSNTNQFTPNFGAQGRYSLNVTDAVGREGWFDSPEFTITGAEAVEPMSARITVNPLSIQVGETIHAEWDVSGGRAPVLVRYIWDVREDNGNRFTTPWQTASSKEETSYTPMVGAEARLYMTYEDADGRTGYQESNTVKITGAELATPITMTSSLSAQTVNQFEEVVASCKDISGGKAPYTISFSWANMDGVLFEETAEQESRYTPEVLGDIYCTISVKDDAGRYAKSYLSFSVMPLPPLPGDANLDKEVTVDDLVCVIEYILFGTPCQSMENANADGEGEVDLKDLMKIVQIIQSQ